jgi:alpha-L-fucosidase
MVSQDMLAEERNRLEMLNKGYENGTIWLPSETDVSVRPGWYYHAAEDHKVKSLARLMDIYYESVGRNSLLLLNLSPDKRGLIHSIDSARMMEWNHQLEQDFSHNLVTSECVFSSGNSRNPGNAFDSNYFSFWESGDNHGYLEVNFGREITCNRLVLQEFIPEGQKVKAFHVQYEVDGDWRLLVRGTTVGYKRILKFLPVKAKKFLIVFDDALAPPMISTISFFNAPVLPVAPEIRRDQAGRITIIPADKNAEIFYTTDGTEPDRTSKKYSEPFNSDGKVTIKAVCYEGTESHGMTGEEHFGHSRASWKVAGDTIPSPALFDGNPFTTWYSKSSPKEAIIDLKKPMTIAGLNYLPDQSRNFRGIPLTYLISVSEDGKTWKLISKGEFPNIRNHPVMQTIQFEKPVKANFLKFEAGNLADGSKVLGIAEMDLISE